MIIRELSEKINSFLESNAKVIVLIGFAIWLVPAFVYDWVCYLPSYYKLLALGWFIISLFLDKKLGWIRRMIIWVSLGNLFDEFFGNPEVPTLLEYVGFELFFIYEWLKYKGWLK